MSYNFYKIMHLMGIFMVLSCLGATSVHIMSGGNKANYLKRKLVSMTHGIGLVLVFIAGFGMMAKQGLKFSENNWLFAKIAIWLYLGMAPVIIYKMSPQRAQIFWFAIYAVAGFGAYLALTKPF